MSVILIVEDEESYRDALSYMLSKEGFQVVLAADGREGLVQFDKHGVVLVLLDLMMPKMDGFAFLTRVRAEPAYAELPIVVLTAKELTEDERELLARNTLLILNKGAQPIGSLGAALGTIASHGH